MSRREQRDPFPTTQWTVVVGALQKGGATAAHGALSKLYTTYYPPLVSYVQRRGYAMHDTEDIVQSYFMQLSEADSFAVLNRKDWKLRRFLLLTLKRFLANWTKSQRARKRGGGASHVPIEDSSIQICDEDAGEAVSDPAFDADWALMILQKVRSQLRDEYGNKDRADRFRLLEPMLGRQAGAMSYREAGVPLGMSEDAVKQEVRRMRKRYREILENHIADTVCDESEIKGELEYLIEVTGRIERHKGAAAGDSNGKSLENGP